MTNPADGTRPYCTTLCQRRPSQSPRISDGTGALPGGVQTWYRREAETAARAHRVRHRRSILLIIFRPLVANVLVHQSLRYQHGLNTNAAITREARVPWDGGTLKCCLIGNFPHAPETLVRAWVYTPNVPSPTNCRVWTNTKIPQIRAKLQRGAIVCPLMRGPRDDPPTFQSNTHVDSAPSRCNPTRKPNTHFLIGRFIIYSSW